MKSVLISIQPKWCELIASGKKTIEVRKNRPKLETPFKCYIYCTLPPKTELFTHGRIREYANELIRLQNGKIVYGYGMQLICDTENRPYSQDNFLCRKVIGEFVCDRIYHIGNNGRFIIDGDQALTNGIARESCLDFRDMRDYLWSRDGYAWHISDLQIYDTPRALDSFRRECVNNLRCESCAMYWNNNGTCGNDALHLHRPPQSWCYVETLE